MIVLGLYYLVALVALVVLVALCGMLYVALRRFGRVRYVAIPVLLMACILLVPMPIHGGFMFLGEVVVDSLKEAIEDRRESASEWLQTRWRERFKTRLPDAVSIAEEIPVDAYWSKVILADGTEAWLDRLEGLVWRDVLLGSGRNEQIPSLIDACRTAGSFTLALEIEMFYFYLHQGPEVMPFADFRYPSLLIEDQLQLEMVKWRNFQASGNRQPASPQIAVRCVGRTQPVPTAGLLDRRISAADWNSFQLAPIR